MKNVLRDLVNYRWLYLLTLVLGIGGSFQYGLQVSIMSSSEQHIQSFVNQTWQWRYGTPLEESTRKLIWTSIVSLLSLGGWVGAIHSGSLPVAYGRKKALQINNVVAMVAAVLMVLAPVAQSFEIILLARFLYGYNAGLGLSVHLMYLGECSPKKQRGFLTLTSCIFIALGKVASPVLGMREALGGENMWPYLMAFGGVAALLQFLTLMHFPEAPRYTYINEGDVEGCKKALRWLWGDEDLKVELDDMAKDLRNMQGQKTQTVCAVLRSRCVRWQVITLTVPCAGIQFSGITALYFYAFDIFRQTGVPEEQMQHMSLGAGATELVSILLCGLLIDRAGRKKLMGYGYLLMGLSMSLLTVTLHYKDYYPWMAGLNISLIFSVISIYALGPGGVCMTLPADLFLQAWRPPAYVISGTICWVGQFVIGMIFPYIVASFQEFCFLIFVVYCFFSGAFMLYFIPETKDKTMVEIMEDFSKLNFKGMKTSSDMKHIELATKL